MFTLRIFARVSRVHHHIQITSPDSSWFFMFRTSDGIMLITILQALFQTRFLTVLRIKFHHIYHTLYGITSCFLSLFLPHCISCFTSIYFTLYKTMFHIMFHAHLPWHWACTLHPLTAWQVQKSSAGYLPVSQHGADKPPDKPKLHQLTAFILVSINALVTALKIFIY